MAIKDNRLKDFFSKQKVGAFDALLNKSEPFKDKSKPIYHNKLEFNESILNESYVPLEEPDSIINNQQFIKKNAQKSQENPLPIRYQSVTNPLAIR